MLIKYEQEIKKKDLKQSVFYKYFIIEFSHWGSALVSSSFRAFNYSQQDTLHQKR